MANPMWKGGLPPSLAAGRYNVSQPSLSDGDETVLQLDASGNLKTNSSISNFPTIQPVSAALGSFVDGAIATLGSGIDPAWNGLDTSTSAMAVLERIASLLNQPQTVQFPSPQPIAPSCDDIDIPSISSTGLAIPHIIDVSGYKSCSIELNGSFTFTLNADGSNTGNTWYIYQPTPFPSGTNAANMTTPGIYWFNLKTHFLKLFCTAFTSNTSFTGRLTLFSEIMGG